VVLSDFHSILFCFLMKIVLSPKDCSNQWLELSAFA